MFDRLKKGLRMERRAMKLATDVSLREGSLHSGAPVLSPM